MKLNDLEELNSLIRILANNLRNIEKLQSAECLQVEATPSGFGNPLEVGVMAGHPDTVAEIVAVLQRANERELKRVGELLGHPVTIKEILAHKDETCCP